MSDESHLQQQQHRPANMQSMPAPTAQSTRMLTATKWITVCIAVLWIPLMILWIMRAYSSLEVVRSIASTGVSNAEASVARLEFVIVLLWATLGAVVLIGIASFLAGAGRSWARIGCTVLLIFPVSVVVVDAIRANAWWGLIVLVPFLVIVVLWWLPGTSRGLKAVSGQASVA